MATSMRLLRSTATGAGSVKTASASTARIGAGRSLLVPRSEPAASPPAAAVPAFFTTLQGRSPQSCPDLWTNSRIATLDLSSTTPGIEPEKPPDSKAKLGKTLRILQDHLPTLLQAPLPQEILSPNITLHLFPSTHPHLPKVSGRVAYMAALWTSPIAWNRVPIIGNVKLEILAERMIDTGGEVAPRPLGAVGERLLVRWRTHGRAKHWGLPFMNGNGGDGNASQRQQQQQQGSLLVRKGKEFTGLFIFDFDKEGRILSHTIEHVEESGQWEQGVGAKVVGLTDWLLGGIKGGGGGGGREGSDTPCPAFARKDS